MKIAIIGTGYVGLVTGACWAELGLNVVCIDVDEQKIEMLRQGDSPIYEPGLKELLKSNIAAGRLTFSTSLKEVIGEVKILFNCVGTPPDEQGNADLSYVYAVAREVGQEMESYKLFVTKSTVPVGTAAKVREIIAEELRKRGEEIEFDVVSNPEFLKEGDAVNDFMQPDRVVVGSDSERARQLLTGLYRPMQLRNFRVIFMDIPSAEMTKYAANAMLATRISFMNDIANLCELVGADVNMVRRGVGSDTRIGNKFLYPGAGYGGSCFPKDIKALINTANDYNYEMRILKAVDAVNNDQKELLFHKLSDHFGGNLKGKRIALWGLSFKPETDDVRFATSLTVGRLLLEAGADVVVYDPAAMENYRAEMGERVEYVEDKYEALTNAEALLIMTEWKEFRMPSWATVQRLMKTPLVIDGRNIYDKEEMEQEGFIYKYIGG